MPRLTVTGTNIDAPDANALADFYRRLLGWTTYAEEPGWDTAGQGLRPNTNRVMVKVRTAGRPVPCPG